MKKFYLLLFLAFVITNSSAQCWNKIAPSYCHNLAIYNDGTLWAWGCNYAGTLGDGTLIDKSIPTQIGTDTNWSSIAVGYGHSVALKTDGTIWAWGNNHFGQLGNGTNTDSFVPIQIGTATDWIFIEAGEYQTVAIKSNGTMWAWGYNQVHGMLGDGTYVDRYVPTQVGVDSDWNSVSFGRSHAVALKNNGTMWSWGSNAQGALGDGTTVNNRNYPSQIGIGFSWQKISTGFLHSMAIRTDGTLWTWGFNDSGQLGDGTIINKNLPTQVGTDNSWNEVSAGQKHCLALKSDKSFWVWGNNLQGQLGLGNTSDVHIPVRLGTLNDWDSIYAGYGHSFSIKTDSNLWAWGFNADYQLGDGTTNNSSTPIKIDCAFLGTHDLKLEKFSVFPNPTDNRLFIMNYLGTTIEKIIIYDITGKKINEISLPKEMIEVNNLKSGMYFLIINSDKTSTVLKFTKF